MDSSNTSKQRHSTVLDARLAVIWRCLLLGAMAGLVAGAVALEVQLIGTEQSGGGFLLGGLAGLLIGGFLGGLSSPLVVHRAGQGNESSTRNRALYAALAILPVLIIWLFLADSDPGWRVAAGVLLSLAIVVGSVFLFIDWCGAPLKQFLDASERG